MLQRTRFTVKATYPNGGRSGVFDAWPLVHRAGSTEDPSQPNDIDRRLPASLETPHLFPVINVIGGAPGPDRNGGMWRPIKWWMFLSERNEHVVNGYLTQVLHVLDYHIKSPNWQGYRNKPFTQWIWEWQHKQPSQYPPRPQFRDAGFPFRKWMRKTGAWQATPPIPVAPPITFLDSGGFALMNKNNFKHALEWYGIETAPKPILDLQLQMGGDIVASLDFPVPPGLPLEDVMERQERSIDNALHMLSLIAERSDCHALPYVAVHGVSRENGRWYVDEFFRRWQRLPPSVREVPFGVAIGSMVPRADDPRLVAEITWGIVQGLKAAEPLLQEAGQFSTPVHMFGVSSFLMPFLVYIGVDTFDSQTYADCAQRTRYLDADLRQTQIETLTDADLQACACPYCQEILTLGIRDRLIELLKSEVEGTYHRLLAADDATNPEAPCTRSDLYALLAMHNWYRISRIVNEMKMAVKENRLADHLVTIVRDHNGQRHNRLKDTLLWLAHTEAKEAGVSRLQEAVTRILGLDLDAQAMLTRPYRTIELKSRGRVYSRDDYEVPTGYRPPSRQDTLLLLACSKGKPYGSSPHQRFVMETLKKELSPIGFSRIHKVTLSGLYGPVPEADENLEQVREYNFRLEQGDEGQIAWVAERLTAYLSATQEYYRHIAIFIFFPGYRDAVNLTLANIANEELKRRIRVIPHVVRRGRTASDYRHELIGHFRSLFGSAQLRLDLASTSENVHTE